MIVDFDHTLVIHYVKAQKYIQIYLFSCCVNGAALPSLSFPGGCHSFQSPQWFSTNNWVLSLFLMGKAVAVQPNLLIQWFRNIHALECTFLLGGWCCPSSAASSWKPTGQSHIPTLFRHSCFGLWGRFSAPSPFIIINNAILSCKQIINYGSSPPSKTTLLFPHLLRIALSPLNHFTANLIHFTVVVTDISSWLQLFIFVMTEEIEGNGKYLDNKIVLEKSYQFFVSYWAVLSRRHIFFCRCFWGRIALLAVFFREITHLTTLVKYTDIC